MKSEKPARLSSNILFCSYYTKNTSYEDDAKRLADSLTRFNLDYRIDGLLPKPSWVENCAQKADYVKTVFLESDRPICWLDADAVVVRQPKRILSFDGDFGVLARNGSQFSGGQVLFGKTAPAKKLIERWVWYTTKFPNIWDQVTLGYAWWDTQIEVGLKTHWLPENIMVKRKGGLAGKLKQKFLYRSAEIYHGQSSRASKTEQKNIDTEFSSADLPYWWREAMKLRKPFALKESQLRDLGINTDL